MYRFAVWLLAACSAGAQVSFYPLAIDQDGLSGAPDFSFLNHPLGPADRLFARDGHFFRVGDDLAPNTDDDERVRLFGVNLAFGANFPSAEDALRIARRLRKLGVNLVRLHHMDSQPDSNPNNAGSLLTTGPYPSLNPVAVARLRAFLDALRAEGIYANLNLHVGYQFRPQVDAVPGPSVPAQSKPLHVFYPRMIDLQTEYTRKVMDALQLNDDAVLAMVEIDNESSLLDAWQRNNLDGALIGEYRSELQRQWNGLLAGRYTSTDALRAAWGGEEADGPELLARAGWIAEVHAPAQATLDPGEVVKVDVTQGGNWVIIKLVGFSISTDRPYLGEIEMRADLADGDSRPVYWDIKQDVSPWNTEVGRTVAVTSRWQKFTLAFQPGFAMERIGRFAVSVENVPGSVYIRNWSLKQAARRGLAPQETLERGTVSLVSSTELATQKRTDDYLLFLTGRDRDYLDRMLAAVRERAGGLVPVTGTQMGYGGLLNLDSHADLDYLDNHFYVDHYGFPNVQWDGRDWTIRDQSAVGNGLDAFQSMAAARQAGKPYTVSEYNQPWPNTHGAEIDPALAAFGAFQDWDAIVHFAYSHGRNWDDGVPNGFNINGDWTKFPNVGQAAWLFRSGAVETGREPLEFAVSQEDRLRAAREKRNGAIGAFLGISSWSFVHPVALATDADATASNIAARAPQAAYESDTGELSYRPGKLYLIHAPKAAGVFGFLEGRKVTAGAIDLELASSARGFAALLLTSLDDQSIADSGRLLLTTPGYTLRSQPGSSPPRPQQLVNYGSTTDRWTLEKEPAFPNKPSGDLNGGIPPVWMERIESYLTLRTSAARLTVYPLDGAGGRLDALSDADVESVGGGFRIHLQADGQTPAPWYEIVAERANGGGAGF